MIAAPPTTVRPRPTRRQPVIPVSSAVPGVNKIRLQDVPLNEASLQSLLASYLEIVPGPFVAPEDYTLLLRTLQGLSPVASEDATPDASLAVAPVGGGGEGTMARLPGDGVAAAPAVQETRIKEEGEEESFGIKEEVEEEEESLGGTSLALAPPFDMTNIVWSPGGATLCMIDPEAPEDHLQPPPPPQTQALDLFLAVADIETSVTYIELDVEVPCQEDGTHSTRVLLEAFCRLQGYAQRKIGRWISQCSTSVYVGTSRRPIAISHDKGFTDAATHFRELGSLVKVMNGEIYWRDEALELAEDGPEFSALRDTFRSLGERGLAIVYIYEEPPVRSPAQFYIKLLSCLTPRTMYPCQQETPPTSHPRALIPRRRYQHPQIAQLGLRRR